MAKNKNPDATSGARRSGPGRHSKKEAILARMALLHDPDGASTVLFGPAPSVDDLVEARGVDDKLSALSGKIADALGKAARGVQIDRFDHMTDREADPGLIKLRAWARQDSPENVVSTTELLYVENERVISALLAHLTEHLVIAEELKSLAAAARRRGADEMARAPAGMLEFIGRLAEAGIVVDDVRKMAADRLATVVRAIKDDEVIAEAPPSTKRASGDPTRVTAVKAVTGNESSNPEKVVLSAELSSPPTETSANEQMLPVNRWDEINLDGLGYRIEEGQPSELEVERAAAIRLPDVACLHELALDTGPENILAKAAESARSIGMLEKFLRRWGERVECVLSKEEQRLWGLLLVEMPFREPALWMPDGEWLPNRMGKKGYFDGLILPPRTGSKLVRRIVAEDRTDLSLALPPIQGR